MTWLFAAACIVYAIQLVVLAANLRHAARLRPESAAGDLPSLSVLVPARNEAANLERLLPQLLEQDHPHFEVIVVDDGSEDATPDVLARHRDARFRHHRTAGPAPGWIGKPHALYVATRMARASRYLFLDADVRLTGRSALSRLAARLEALPDRRVLTGMPRIRGGGLLLVSQVPAAILSGLPWPLVGRSRSAVFAGVNGQCWAIRADTYHRFEPHAAHRAEILEDVEIGRSLTRHGHFPVLADLREVLSVHMYGNFAEAWRGFRKNAYLIMGGRPSTFIPIWLAFTGMYVAAPIVFPVLFLPLYVMKSTTDRFVRAPWWLSIAAPLSYLAAAVLQLDSFAHHVAGRVEWKGRRVV